MKKRTMAVGGLLLAVAMTGYSVAGTYAKYTSQIDLTDEARIAKWEFKATNVDGSVITDNKINLFADSYYLDDDTKLYVKSSNSDKVIAPGTTGSYAFNLAGNMEVRYILNFDIDTAKDFIVYYTVNENGKVTNKSGDKETLINGGVNEADIKEYRPLRYTINYTRGNDTTDLTKGLIKNMTLVELKSALEQHVASHPEGFNPGEMDQKYVITWAWNTENKDLAEEEIDILDTFAGEYLSNSENKVEVGIKIVATQIAEDYSSVDGRKTAN